MRRRFLRRADALRFNKMNHRGTNTESLLPEGEGLCLDLGAGNGKHKSAVERKGRRWVGLDISANDNLSVVADAENLPFAAGVFDCVFACQSFEHFPHPWRAAGEVARVLRRGGVLAGSVSFLEPFHDSYYGLSHWAIEDMLTENSLEIVEIRPGASVFVILGWSLFPDHWIGEVLGTLAGRVGIFLHRTATTAYMGLRFGKKSEEWRKFQGFWDKAPLRFSGHIMFVGKKT